MNSSRYCFSLVVALLASPIQADEFNFSSELELQLQYDDNVFLFSDSESASELVGNDQRSDFIIDAIARGVSEYESDAHQLRVQGSVFRNQYSEYDVLNYTGGNLNVDWGWDISPRWDTEFSYDFRKDQSSFGDENLAQGDVYNQQLANGKVIYALGQSSDLYLGSSFKSRDYELRKILENERTDVHLGVVVFSTLDNSIGFEVNHGSGEYPQRVGAANFDDRLRDYTEDLFSAYIDYKIGESSELNASVGYVNREHNEEVAGFDYSGIVYDLRLDWDLSARTEITTQYSRSLRDTENSITAFNRDERLRAAVTWEYSNRVTVNSSLNFLDTDFIQAGENRKDSAIIFDAGVDYEIGMSSVMGINFRLRDRSSNRQQNEYDNAIVTLSYAYRFD